MTTTNINEIMLTPFLRARILMNLCEYLWNSKLLVINDY